MHSFMIKEIQNEYKGETLIKNYKKILTCIAPIIPHYANECLDMIGHKENIVWPSYDKNILHENTVPIVIQINGKKRGLIEVKRDIGEVDLLELIFKNKNLEKYLINKEVRKKIYVKNRLINIIL